LETDLVGRCGIYCGACGVYRACVDGGEYREHVIREWAIPGEKLRCRGCQALTPDCWGSGCETVRCLDSKGYRFCHECAAFMGRSCRRYEEVAAKYLGRGQDIRAALDRIRAGDADVWLREQRERWRCPSCGRRISWFPGRCFGCGEAVNIKITPRE